MENNIHKFLYELLLNEYGQETASSIIEGYSKERPVTIRVNTIKSNLENIKHELNKQNILFKNVEWYQNALIIENAREDKIKELEIYKNGEIYMQSLSSMIPAIVLSPKKDENILDMTAAPGGKTTQIAALSNNESMITACEKNKIRVERLKYNIDKQGAKKVNIMIEDARKLNDFFSFDKILLDAPCSGSGTENIYKENFTQELIDRSVKTQEELLKKALKILKQGKDMVYSTCSILKEENENVLKRLLTKSNAEIVPIEKELLKGIPLLPTSLEGVICVAPTHLYEGFFVAKIRKK